MGVPSAREQGMGKEEPAEARRDAEGRGGTRRDAEGRGGTEGRRDRELGELDELF